MDQYRVLVAMPMDEGQQAKLCEMWKGHTVLFADPKTVTRDMAQNADVVIGNISPRLLEGSSRIKWVQLNSAGTDGYTSALPKGALLTNATGAYGLAISEYMLAGLLSVYKQFPSYFKHQRTHRWHSLGQGSVRSVYGATVLILGLGDIGGEFAKKVKALGAYTIGIRRKDTRKPAYLDELYLTDQIDEVIDRADVVAMSLPGTKETAKIMNRARIEKMKEGAVLINVGRGSAVDTDALNDALVSGRLCGAVLDVTEPEPLPADHPLWDAPNAIITPHISGGYSLHATYLKILTIIEKNIELFLRGEKLMNLVDFETGYRAL